MNLLPMENPKSLRALIQILWCSFYTRRAGFRQHLCSFESIVSGVPTTTGQTAFCPSPVHMTAWQVAVKLQTALAGVMG